MPKVFLSPSTQEWNKYVTGGSEEQYMNLLADKMEPYLTASGISYTRNDPNKNVNGAIEDSNNGKYDVHLALHTNAGGGQFAGKLTGIDIYYAPASEWSRKLAVITANNLKPIYPKPSKVNVRPTTYLAEVTRTAAPAILAELGYHDNYEDEKWIKDNLDMIARTMVLSLCDYFGIPFVEPGPVRSGIVTTDGSNLNLRKFPSTAGAIILSMPNGSPVTIYGQTDNWYVVGYGTHIGYASSDFITIV